MGQPKRVGNGQKSSPTFHLVRASRLRVPAVYLGWANPVFLAFFPFNRISYLRVFNAVFSSIPIARSITHDDPIGLTRLSYLNPSKKWTVLDPSGPQRA